MASNKLTYDRAARDPHRVYRDSQRLVKGAININISVDPAGALYLGSGGLGVNVDGTTIQIVDNELTAVSGSTPIDNNTILSNISGSSASAIGNSLSDILDTIIGSTQNDLLVRGSSSWQALSGASSGKILGVSPITDTFGYDSIADFLIAVGSTRGDIMYFGASGWTTLDPGTEGYVLTSGGSGADPSWAAVSGGSDGTVTSVALAMPGIFSVAGSPVTTSGEFDVTLATENANYVWAGPTSGSAAAPEFRALVVADIPDLSADYDVYGSAATAQTNAESHASDASNLSSGTVPAGLLPLASSSSFGAVKVDGTTITASSGVISSVGGATGANPSATAGPTAVNGSATTFMRSDAAPEIQKASASQFGIVEVDGTTITAASGVISAASSGGSPFLNTTNVNLTSALTAFPLAVGKASTTSGDSTGLALYNTLTNTFMPGASIILTNNGTKPFSLAFNMQESDSATGTFNGALLPAMTLFANGKSCGLVTTGIAQANAATAALSSVLSTQPPNGILVMHTMISGGSGIGNVGGGAGHSEYLYIGSSPTTGTYIQTVGLGTVATGTTGGGVLNLYNQAGTQKISLDVSGGACYLGLPLGVGVGASPTGPTFQVQGLVATQPAATVTGAASASVSIFEAYINGNTAGFGVSNTGAPQARVSSTNYAMPSTRATAANKSVSNTTTETAFLSYTIPANSLTTTAMFSIFAAGFVTSTSGGTCAITLNIGSHVVATYTFSAVTGFPLFSINAIFGCSTTGSSGIIAVAGQVIYAPGGTTTPAVLGNNDVTVDTTSTIVVTISAQWTTATSDNNAVLCAGAIECISP